MIVSPNTVTFAPGDTLITRCGDEELARASSTTSGEAAPLEDDTSPGTDCSNVPSRAVLPLLCVLFVDAFHVPFADALPPLGVVPLPPSSNSVVSVRSRDISSSLNRT